MPLNRFLNMLSSNWITRDNILESCASKNDCILSQEWELIKKFSWRIYRIFKNAVVKTKDSFGDSKKAIDVIVKTSFKYGNQKLFGPVASNIREEDKSKYGMIADNLIDDFESKKCQERVAKNSGTNANVSNLIVVSISLILMLIFH